MHLFRKMEDAIDAYEAQHGHRPVAIMLTDDQVTEYLQIMHTASMMREHYHPDKDKMFFGNTKIIRASRVVTPSEVPHA